MLYGEEDRKIEVPQPTVVQVAYGLEKVVGHLAVPAWSWVASASSSLAPGTSWLHQQGDTMYRMQWERIEQPKVDDPFREGLITLHANDWDGSLLFDVISGKLFRTKDGYWYEGVAVKMGV